jgi:geranylgeranyl transferase type-1 subunit beta
MSYPPLESTPVVATGVAVSDDLRLPALNKVGHVAHCVRCLDGLPASLVEMDASRSVSLTSLSLLSSDLLHLQNGDCILLSGHA